MNNAAKSSILVGLNIGVILVLSVKSLSEIFSLTIVNNAARDRSLEELRLVLFLTIYYVKGLELDVYML